MTIFRILTWCCVILLTVLSLLPGRALDELSLTPVLTMLKTLIPAPLEHFIAYAGSAAITVGGYGPSKGSVRIIGALCLLAGILEYVRHFSPGRHPSIEDFAGSALGALCGGLVVILFRSRRSDQPR